MPNNTVQLSLVGKAEEFVMFMLFSCLFVEEFVTRKFSLPPVTETFADPMTGPSWDHKEGLSEVSLKRSMTPVRAKVCCIAVIQTKVKMYFCTSYN